MAGNSYTTPSQTGANKILSGGLNSTSGPLNVQENESSDLQNIDFNKFGSILKRNGYASAGTATLNKAIDGLHWFEFASGGTSGRMAVGVAGGSMFVSALAGVWTGVSNGVTISSAYHCDFENWLNRVWVTTGTNTPFYYAGSGSCNTANVPTGVLRPKYVRQFNNYLFYGNVAIGGTDMPSRIYWSGLKTDTFASDQFIEVSKDDGQAITGLKVLGDRLVVYKERSIYNVYFTGDADIPFIMPGGGKSNSSVGCVAPWSIQEVENGNVFLSFDGLYYYDGLNSYKISDRITTTLTESITQTKFAQGVSCVQKAKNRYFLSLPTENNNNRIIFWDYYNNAFSIYIGMSASAMATTYINGIDERPYFGDYNGYIYRMDNGDDDYPLNVQTAINAYYYTNWKYFEDLCDQKGIPHVYIYYALDSSNLTFAYSYDFENSDQYSNIFNMGTGLDVFGIGLYGTATYAGTGGKVSRRDLTGRGRVARFKVANANLGETFRIDGIGSFVHAETNI